MTPTEFVAWMKGYMAAAGIADVVKQPILEALEQVKVPEVPVWPWSPPLYPYTPYCGTVSTSDKLSIK